MSDELQKPDQQNEPSVLDYVKSLFRFGNERIQIPEFVEEELSAISDQQLADSSQAEEVRSEAIPHSARWAGRSIAANGFSPPSRRHPKAQTRSPIADSLCSSALHWRL